MNQEIKINRKALFSDGTELFRQPVDPNPGDTVTVYIRVMLGESVEVILHLIEGEEEFLLPMTCMKTDSLFDYYGTSITLTDKRVEYFFEIKKGSDVCYYNSSGISEYPADIGRFVIVPGFSVPNWAKGAVYYQIYVDRFCKGNITNNVVDGEYQYIGEHVCSVKDWYRYPEAMDVREFYGGDLKGVIKKLDYLKDLGIEVIYFNPLFVSPSNHKYDSQDYDYIDPHIGEIVVDGGEPLPMGDKDNSHATKYIIRTTNIKNLEASNQLFIRLVEEAHNRGIRVILDGVFNHCGSFNKWLDKERIYENCEGYEKGAYISEFSPYNSFFKFNRDEWPYNGSYDGWWSHDTLPKLNYEESPKLFEYIMRIARKWVSPPYNADGWRLDVAADLGYSPEFNHFFWREFRRNVKEANPQAIILAEHYGDPISWLQGDQWDSVMNYDAFMEPITWFLTGMEKHSDQFKPELMNNAEYFFHAMNYYMSRFSNQSLQSAMNELSNHDHSRFLTRTNHRVGRTQSAGSEEANQGVNTAVMREAVVMQMTWPGAPAIYYGDEAGVCGWTDPDNRRTYPWGREDTELIEFHKVIIRIHKSYPALKTGSFCFLADGGGYLAYGRFDETDKIVIAVNNNYWDQDINIPVWQVGVSDQERLVTLIITNDEGYNLIAQMYRVSNGYVKISMPPLSAMVLKNTHLY